MMAKNLIDFNPLRIERIRIRGNLILVTSLLVLGLYGVTCSGMDPNLLTLKEPNIFPVTPITTLETGETFSLSCHGDAELTWSTPSNEVSKRIMIKNELNGEGLRPFVSHLTLINVSHYEIGSFECYYTSDDERLLGSAYAYLYVEDAENLLVPQEPGGVLTATKGIPFAIPCKPTTPSVIVTLRQEGHLIDPEQDPSVTFDPRFGFTINPGLKSAGIYECSGQRGLKEQKLSMYLHVNDILKDSIQTPIINATLANAIQVGERFILDCVVETTTNRFFYLNWTEPQEVINSGRATMVSKLFDTFERRRYNVELTVIKARKEDGLKPYKCVVDSGSTKKSAYAKVRIFLPGEEYLEMNSSNDGNITVNASDQAIWVIDVHGYPAPNDFYWTAPDKTELGALGSNPKYNIEIRFNQVILTITPVSQTDDGVYQFTARNRAVTKTIDLPLTVRDSPNVTIDEPERKKYFMVNQYYNFSCRAYGYPYPTVEWYSQECEDYATESGCGDYTHIPVNIEPFHSLYKDSPRYARRDLLYNVTRSARLTCVANNSIGENETTQSIIAIDEKQNGFSIAGPTQPVEQDSVTYNCASSRYTFADDNKMFFKGTSHVEKIPVDQLEGASVRRIKTAWSNQLILQIQNISIQHSGSYFCEVKNLNPDEDQTEIGTEDNLTVNVRKILIPVITSTNLNSSDFTFNPGHKDANLFCNATGVPTPEISWFKDDMPQEKWPRLDQIRVVDGNLTLGYVELEHAGTYTCRASNRFGSDERSIKIIVDQEFWKENIVPLSIIVGSVIIILIAIICYIVRRERKIKRFLKKLRLQEFENGDVEKINPEEGVESQVNLLPYDKKFEFPRERLRLGIQLGAGAFGRVVRAEATGIVEGETQTTVAVKMVKPNADESHFKALMSELKIMIHLGQHVNVVNLLGACTKQLVKKRELFVIVEYCKYGSLLSYLHRHRSEFIDQLDRVRDVVDPNIYYPVEPHYLSPSQSQVNPARRTPVQGYFTMDQIPTTPDGPVQGPSTRPSSEEYILSTNLPSMCTDMSMVSNSHGVTGTDGKRRSSSCSSWNGHYRGVYQYRDVRPITTTDLMCWSFQCARGMEYLASRKVLHGDLAARNVLLAENNVVKICDFGLAKEMYKEKYKKKSEGVLLPVKWMAVESIYFGVFSTQSDVWSLGVVMWELFTLGKTPYPGMEADEKFCKMLNDGYRMEKPAYAPSSIYDLMTDCWNHEPSARPSFSALVDRIGDLMEEGLRQHYIDLNAPHTCYNQVRLDGCEDYLGKMCGPDFNSVSKGATPDRTYANVTVNNPSNPDYLLQGPSGLIVPVQLPNPESSNETPNYKNLDHGSMTQDPRLHQLANNEGYLYMNTSGNGVECNNDLRPENEKNSVFNVPDNETNFSDNYVSLQVGKPSEEILGVSNMNYVANTICLPSSPERTPDRSPESPEPIPNSKDDDIHHSGKCDLRRDRQKNDSGVSSVDSNFEFSHKGSSPKSSCEIHQNTRNDRDSNLNIETNQLPFSKSQKTEGHESQTSILPKAGQKITAM